MALKHACLDNVTCMLQVFASLYTLTKNRTTVSVRITAIRVLLEFIQVGFMVVKHYVGLLQRVELW